MDPGRWSEISELAAAAAETSPEDRDALLRSRPDLRAEIESLLRYLDPGSGPLDRPPHSRAGSHYEGMRIGSYKVIGELGAGGMGVVLLARRDEPDFEQLVAVKLARVSMQSEFLSRRFLEERQILAKLEHPNIARLIDGGVMDDGTPFLVMQYVPGVPLNEWCATQNLDLPGRLFLLLKICAAVGYSHEHLVVHRDLKPANILVTASGEPMLLDFGTARLLDQALQTGSTATQLPMLTARYASPEQVAGMSGSTRSDVYSLGVILYELLTGQWPYEVESESTPAMLRAVSEREPVPPSRRGTSAELRAQIAGDLDAILLKALDKVPERRYATVQQFADDLRRHLANEPVAARTPTLAYRTGRFVRRNRWGVAAALLMAMSLSAATGFSIRVANIAERERQKAVQVSVFLEQLLGASPGGGVSALATGGRNLKVVDLIESAAARVGEEFKNSPDVEVGLRSTIGSALMALGASEKARPHVERAVILSQQLYGDNHAVSTRALTARGRLRLAAGDYAGAQSDLEKTLTWHVAAQSPDLPFQYSLLAETRFRQADIQGARRHFEEALKAMRRQFGDRHVTTATMINNLGVVADDAGDAAAAEKHFAEAAAVLRTLPGPPGNLVYPLMGLQRAHFFRREYTQAKALCEEAHRHALRTGGDRHPNTASAAMQLALVKAHLGEPDAGQLALETLALQRIVHPATHMEISRGLTTVGRVLILRGEAGKAVPFLREAYEIARKVYPKANWRTAEPRIFLGAALAVQGKASDAAILLDEGVREISAVLPESHPRVAEARRIRQRCLAEAAGCTQ